MARRRDELARRAECEPRVLGPAKPGMYSAATSSPMSFSTMPSLAVTIRVATSKKRFMRAVNADGPMRSASGVEPRTSANSMLILTSAPPAWTTRNTSKHSVQ